MVAWMAKKKRSTRSLKSKQLELGFRDGRVALTKAQSKAPAAKPKKRGAKKSMRPPARPRVLPKRATAESMAAEQRHISISEFFAKNRHLLGFDNKRKALLTTVKEAVDNSLDACEEAHILPEIHVEIRQTDEDRYRVKVRDNGPGIVKEQIPNIFGKLLYGSKFHRLKMSRGQQGIGISAAGMYGLLTTGRPIHITSRIAGKREAHHYQLQIDTKKNKPEIIKDEKVTVEWKHGTEVMIDLVAGYIKGRQSVDEYMLQTAIANPHCAFTYKSPTDAAVEYPRSVEELPALPLEIKPHPHGVELGIMIKMLDDASTKYLGAFLQKDFSRVSSRVADRVCKAAGLTARSYLGRLNGQDIERVYKELQKTKLMAPPTNCLAPIGAEQILSGLLQGVKAEFYSASTRPPAVYRGNPFQIEVGLAYGGELGPDERDKHEQNGKKAEPVQARVLRFANRVPLLYQQSGCCMHKSVVQTKWGNYGISQSRGTLPSAPLLILIHVASVWVPFTSESKEAVADYDEIRKEIKLAIAECGRRLGTLLKRKKKKQAHARRRDVFTRYIDEVVNATRSIRVINKDRFKADLVRLARQSTLAADMEFDEHGKRIDRRADSEAMLEYTLVVDRDSEVDGQSETLFEDDSKPRKRAAPKSQRKKAPRKKRKAVRR